MTRYITDSIPTDADRDAVFLKRVLADWQPSPKPADRRAAAQTIRALRKIGALK